MMFVLGACWAQDPPREFLGLRGQILVKDCNSDVKTPYFVGTKHIVWKRVIGLFALNFFIVMSTVEIYPWSADHGIA